MTRKEMLKMLGLMPVIGGMSYAKRFIGNTESPSSRSFIPFDDTNNSLITRQDNNSTEIAIPSDNNRGRKNEFFTTNLTQPGSFTHGVEGPAVDSKGNIYACNFARQHTIGKVTPSGDASIFVELPDDSVGCGMRFNSKGEMLIADYVNHNIFKVDMDTRELSVFVHEPKMNQPNDLAIGKNDVLYASDPDWNNSTGQLWRIDPDGTTHLLEDEMGTTNGIALSPHGKILYVNESIQRRVWAYDLSPKGEISNKRLFMRFNNYGLDGMRCDISGNLYISRYGTGSVVKVSPSGKVLRKALLAEGKAVSNLTFGGPSGRMVYMTVADVGNLQMFRTDKPGRTWMMLYGN